MTGQNHEKLNLLQRKLPEGLLVDAAWMTRHGYSTSLRSQYVSAGWLEQPVRGVFMRPLAELNREKGLRWEQAVISLQTLLLDNPVTVGGRTALEMEGYAHFLAKDQPEVHLYGKRRPPSWLGKLPLATRFVFHRDGRLFRDRPVTQGLASHFFSLKTYGARNTADGQRGGRIEQPWGQWDWPLSLSSPERAVLELLDELPGRESFHQVDKLMEGMVGLRPSRLQSLLEDCTSVKVKRLFLYFADRHAHAWLKRIDRERIDLGSGKRALVRGGRLVPAYGITVPRDMDALS